MIKCLNIPRTQYNNMKIHQIYTDNDLRNFTYVIELKNRTALVVDPWSEQQVNDILQKNKLKLTTIINTHEHWDHVQGNDALVKQYNCEVWAHENGIDKIPHLSHSFSEHEKVNLEADVIMEVIETPGHCHAHLCFIIHIKGKAEYIFTGDILFNAGVGNCHDGDVNEMYTTIKDKFQTLPSDITILPGHEYLENNLKFTLDREPSNTVAKKWLEKYKQSDIHNKPLTTTMADEREINTFLRLKSDEIIKNLPNQTPGDKEVFIQLRALRDKW